MITAGAFWYDNHSPSLNPKNHGSDRAFVTPSPSSLPKLRFGEERHHAVLGLDADIFQNSQFGIGSRYFARLDAPGAQTVAVDQKLLFRLDAMSRAAIEHDRAVADA